MITYRNLKTVYTKIANVIFFVLLVTLTNCSNDTNKNVTTKQQEIVLNPVKISDFKFPYPDAKSMQFFINKGKLLYENEYDRDTYEKVVKEYISTFGNKTKADLVPYEQFENLRKQLFKTFKEQHEQSAGRLAQTTVLTPEATTLSNNITNLLNEATDKSDFINRVNKSILLVNSADKVSQNEKDWILFSIESVKTMALATDQSASNGRVASINDAPTCRWWKWGCVFALTLGNIGTLILFDITVGNSDLHALVAEYGINYIAQCCFCGCNCPDGCPTF